MVVKSSLLGTWKQTLWTRLFSGFSRALSSTQKDNIILTNAFITEQCCNGRLGVARDVFDRMPNRTLVSWNTMISGYSKRGRYEEALSLVSMMQKGNTRLNETTFSTILTVCRRSGSMDEGKDVHCLVVKSGFESFELVGSALLRMPSEFLTSFVSKNTVVGLWRFHLKS
ncbi:hypothetical protein F8388_006163 [Cannabis sativa]|uniref:Pentatricopeptide repeat-containing protein n=1 Tax=Cannabis sativa TaxID=3483 RepID=A0A7J6G7C9_CANSA|nr:hypothetical protein F8388_006163 [Cannabis sativa]